MKRMVQKRVLLAVLVSVSGWVKASVVEKPAVMPEAMVSVTVSDLQGFIDGVGQVAASASPVANGMMLKNMLGMQMNDPGLSGIASGKGLSIVVLDPTNLFAVVEVSEAKAPAYKAVLAQKGVQSVYTNGVLIVASDAAQITKGISLVSSVKENLLATRSPTLRIAAQPAGLYAKNQEKVDGMMQMLPTMMGMSMMRAPGVDPASIQSSIHIVEGEVRFLLSIAKQCETLGLVLAPQGGSIRISKTIVPKSGTHLAALVNAPNVSQPNPKIQCGLLGEAAISVDSTISNPDAFSTFISDEMDVVLKEMNIDTASFAGLDEVLKKWLAIYSGSFSETVSFGGKQFVDVKYVTEAKDEEQVMACFRSIEKDMAPFIKLYESMGMPMTVEFKENVREYKGVKIHQYKTGVTMPEAEQAELQAMNVDMTNMVYDLAICDGLVLYAMGDTPIETLIDRVKDSEFTAKPLKARSIYPADGFYYCDIDIAQYISGISSILPKDPSNPLPQMANMLQGADPITSAGFNEDGMVMWSVDIPGTLLSRIGQAVMMMQMQKMQQANPAMMPGAAPAAMPAVETPAIPTP